MSLKKVKGYKLTDCKREKRFGVACSSLKEFIEKGKKKLDINDNIKVTVHLQDGTVVDSESYFSTLPSQTFLVIRKPDEYLPNGADLIYNALKMVNVDVLRTGELVQQFFDEKIKEKLQVLTTAIIQKRVEQNKRKKKISKDLNDDNLLKQIDKTKCSTREDDPDWFLGLETNAKTKESFMFKRSQDRIRGYYYKTQMDIKRNPVINNGINSDQILFIIDNVFNNFKVDLLKDQYFGCYLDRSQSGAMCDKYGEFICGGTWKQEQCLYKGAMPHVINPYASREERILFSTWNLDHGVERSRTIIPAIIDASIQAAKLKDTYTVNTPYFYSLLFTSNNLRLVHVVCHDKSKHDTAVCDTKKYLIQINGNNNLISND